MNEPRIVWPPDELLAGLAEAILVTVTVEISDQMGTSRAIPVGVFTDRDAMRAAVFAADAKYINRRTAFTFQRIGINKLMILPT